MTTPRPDLVVAVTSAIATRIRTRKWMGSLPVSGATAAVPACSHDDILREMETEAQCLAVARRGELDEELLRLCAPEDREVIVAVAQSVRSGMDENGLVRKLEEVDFTEQYVYMREEVMDREGWGS